MGERINYPLMYRISGSMPMCVGSASQAAKPTRVAQSPSLESVRPLLRKHPEDYIREAAGFGLQFGEDVLREHCFHLLPYDPKYLKAATDPAGLLYAKGRPGANKNQASLRYKAILKSTRPVPAKLDPLVIKKNKPATAESQFADKETQENRQVCPKPLVEDVETQGVFLTEDLSEAVKTPSSGIQPSQWDEYVMSNLSENTAHWIVRGKMSPGNHRDRMVRFLEMRYGPMNEDAGKELVEDSLSEVDFSLKPTPPCEKLYKKSDKVMLERVREVIEAQNYLGSPMESEQSANFYHLPTGNLQSSRTQLQLVETGTLNKTAENVEVTPYRIPSPPTLKDVLNPKVGEKYYHSTSLFVQDWLTGGKPLHQKDSFQIKMDSDNVYRKRLRRTLPYRSTEWSSETKENVATECSGKAVAIKHRRGVEKWQALPEKVEDSNGSQLNPLPYAISRRRSVAHSVVLHESVLTRILSEWKSQWRLEVHDTQLSVEDLIREMGDIHPNTRIKAIVTCSRAAEYRRTDEKSRTESPRLLPEELCVALELCLRDENERVRTAAAIVLYSLERPVPEAEAVLRNTLQQDHLLNGWTAARCLAHYGECDYQVVGELVDQLFNSKDDERKSQATEHLVQLSRFSTLVHSMIAERLNSCSWADRLTACTTISVLQGDINRDLISKLSHMMWNDWRLEVRRAAAQTLGHTSHGVDIHNQLVEKLQHGDERARLDAIGRLGDLGIMTTRLFPVFLKCFNDGSSSLRMEACVACMNLHLINDAILTKLVSLAGNDRVWKVKALAIQALGFSGVVTEAVRKTLIWAFRYDTEEGVRAEACRAVTALQLKGDDIVQILQDRYLVETSDLVKQQIVHALSICGISPTQDTPILTQIKTEVKRLGTNENIQLHILANDAEENREANKRKLIYTDPNKKQLNSSASAKRREFQMQRLKASFQSSHHHRQPTSVLPSDRDVVGNRNFRSAEERDENDIVTTHIQSSVPSFLKDYLAQREKSSDSHFNIERESSGTSVQGRNISPKSILPNELSCTKEWESVNAGRDTSEDSKDRTGGNSRSDDDGNSINKALSSPCGATDESNTGRKENTTREGKNYITDENTFTDTRSCSKMVEVRLETDDEAAEEGMLKSPKETVKKPELSKMAEDELNDSFELGSDDDSFIY